MAHLAQQPKIVPTENDVLCGRGVNIAHHPGNERFRTLVNTKREVSRKESNTATEKRQMAQEIIRHIKSLNPPGRFLKRECAPGRRSSSRGKNGTGLDLSGIWEVVSDREAIKKTCQALRDSCREDRNGYAIGVVAPQDVVDAASKAGLKREAPSPSDENNGNEENGGRASPSVENAASWLKKQKFQPQPEIQSASPLADGANASQEALLNAGSLIMQMPHEAQAPATNGTASKPEVSNVEVAQNPTEGHTGPGTNACAGNEQPLSTNNSIAQTFASNWNQASSSATFSNDDPQQAQSIDVLQFQNAVAGMQQSMGTSDWGAAGQLQSLPQQQDALSVDLGAPGDPGALNITEL